MDLGERFTQVHTEKLCDENDSRAKRKNDCHIKIFNAPGLVFLFSDFHSIATYRTCLSVADAQPLAFTARDA